MPDAVLQSLASRGSRAADRIKVLKVIGNGCGLGGLDLDLNDILEILQHCTSLPFDQGEILEAWLNEKEGNTQNISESGRKPKNTRKRKNKQE